MCFAVWLLPSLQKPVAGNGLQELVFPSRPVVIVWSTTFLRSYASFCDGND